MNILDMESKEWEVGFRYWPQGNCKTYVLDRLIDFMASRKLQAGDMGNFYYICDKFALFTNIYIIIQRWKDPQKDYYYWHCIPTYLIIKI